MSIREENISLGAKIEMTGIAKKLLILLFEIKLL